jgi:GNAT superfamily N-acetyltransferase
MLMVRSKEPFRGVRSRELPEPPSAPDRTKVCNSTANLPPRDPCISHVVHWGSTLFMKLQNEGLGQTLRQLVRFLLPASYRIYELDLALFRYEYPEFSASISASSNAPQNLKSMRDQVHLPAEFYRDLTEAPLVCILACVPESVAGIAWLYDHTRPGPFLKMAPGEIVLRQLYVLEPFRGKGVATPIIREACRWCRECGFLKVYAVVRSDNPGSEAAFNKVGLKVVATLLRSTMLGRRYVSPS